MAAKQLPSQFKCFLIRAVMTLMPVITTPAQIATMALVFIPDAQIPKHAIIIILPVVMMDRVCLFPAAWMKVPAIITRWPNVITINAFILAA
jgi:hypothetical protein